MKDFPTIHKCNNSLRLYYKQFVLLMQNHQNTSSHFHHITDHEYVNWIILFRTGNKQCVTTYVLWSFDVFSLFTNIPVPKLYTFNPKVNSNATHFIGFHRTLAERWSSYWLMWETATHIFFSLHKSGLKISH